MSRRSIQRYKSLDCPTYTGHLQCLHLVTAQKTINASPCAKPYGRVYRTSHAYVNNLFPPGGGSLSLTLPPWRGKVGMGGRAAENSIDSRSHRSVELTRGCVREARAEGPVRSGPTQPHSASRLACKIGMMSGMRSDESIPIDISEISARAFRSEWEVRSCELLSPCCR